MKKDLKVSDVRKAIEMKGIPMTTNFSTVPKEEVLETIVQLDEIAASIAEFSEYVREQREKLLTRAMVENIDRTGQFYLITIPGPLKRNQIDNIIKFAERFPEGYKAIRNQQGQDLIDKFNRDLERLKFSEIPLTLADKKIGKDAVSEYVGFKPQEVKAEVRKLPEAIQ
jgi:hypothetical protein